MFKSPKELKAIMALARAARFIHGSLERIGLHPPGGRHLEDFLKIGSEILRVTDSFNDMFASRGWIAHSRLNVKAAIAAMEEGRANKWQRADEILAESYSPILVRALVINLSRLRCFRDRARLAELAVHDYEAGRYHACIPVVLALIDGMGQQVLGAGLFRASVRISVSNSIVGLGVGLSTLLKTMLVSRKKTTTDQIAIPFRHGILHGTDLGYDTHVVAAKTWSALFAVAEYAESIENPTKETVRPGLLEVMRGYATHRRSMDEIDRYLASWRGRPKEELENIVANQTKTSGTPEAVAMDLVDSWRSRNFGGLASATMQATKTDARRLAGEIRRTLVGPPPTSYRVVEIMEDAPAATNVTLVLHWNENSDEVVLRLLCMKDGEIAPSGMPGTRWYVMSLWPLETVRHQSDSDGEQPAVT